MVDVCVCVAVRCSDVGGSSVDSFCLQLLISVELLVSAVQLSGSCLQPGSAISSGGVGGAGGGGLASTATSPASQSLAARHCLVFDVHTNLAQIIQQLARDIDVFWQVVHSQWALVTIRSNQIKFGFNMGCQTATLHKIN